MNLQSFFSLSCKLLPLFSLERIFISLFVKEVGPSSIITSSSPSSLPVVTASLLPAQAGSALSSLSTVVAAPALTRNIVVAVPPALAEFIIFIQILPVTAFTSALQVNPVILPDLSPHTGAQALSAYKRAWYYKPIQKSVLITGLNNLNQLTVHTQLYKSILMT
ncbi:uncharacterized protein CIMG_10877 [Coccidioides immitis RS]|uniref:Uncharacterized protein n=1 Tax=Coccidioides immitis (strain RS) TaxID=246410 RepID=A0A0D8JRZ0_COCIM|nr:uncharacterized protein CIMG_10877 [Coccidioides immitis RS]KJF60062.1 hypothetical protein CIMG_10877 [Coccidioides immitis RS]